MASFKAIFPVLQELFAKKHRGGPLAPHPAGRGLIWHPSVYLIPRYKLGHSHIALRTQCNVYEMQCNVQCSRNIWTYFKLTLIPEKDPKNTIDYVIHVSLTAQPQGDCDLSSVSQVSVSVSQPLVSVSVSAKSDSQVSKRSYFDIGHFWKSYCWLRLIWGLDHRSRSRRSRYILPGAGGGAGAAEKFYSEPEPEPEPECFPGAGAGAGADQKCHGSASLVITQPFLKISTWNFIYIFISHCHLTYYMFFWNFLFLGENVSEI